jgi:hypothetical protein
MSRVGGLSISRALRVSQSCRWTYDEQNGLSDGRELDSKRA